MNARGNATIGPARSNSSYETTDDLEPFQVAVSVFLAVNTLLILVLNPLGLVVLRRAGGIQQTTKILMASLTVSDTCTGVVSAVQLIESLSSRQVLGGFLCGLFKILSPILVSVNAYSLVLLTVDRYVAIVHSLCYATLMTIRRTKILVVLVWGCAATSHIVLYVTKAGSEEHAENVNLCLAVHCTACYLIYNLNLVISTSVVLVLYFRILKVARGHARRIAAQIRAGGGHRDQNAPQPISTKSATTVLIITAAVGITWAAPVLLSIFAYYGFLSTEGPLETFLATIYFSNSWLNVVIYYWRNKELRQALRSLTASSCCCHVPIPN